MARKVLSIETGIWWTKVAVVEPKKKNPVVSRVFYFETPEHSVEDGYIRDKEAFSIALKKALEENEVEEKDVVFSLNSSKIVTREITIPAIKDNQIQGVLDTQAKDYFPMDVSDYSITYIKMKNLSENGNVSSLQDEESETSVYMEADSEKDVKTLIKNKKKKRDAAANENLKLLLIAVPENLQNNYISLCEMADLKFDSFEYLASSAGSFITQHFTENSIVIQVVDQSTIVSLIADGKLEFIRVAPYGYGTTISTILDNPVLGCTTEKSAFKFLTEHNVFEETPDIAAFKKADADDEEKLKKALVGAFEDVADSLSYHKRLVLTALDYYKSQTKTEFKGTIHFIGEGVSIKGLSNEIEKAIGLESSKNDYFGLMNLSKEAIADTADLDATDFVAVIGGAFKPLNLLPSTMVNSTASEEELRKVKQLFLAVCVVCVLIVVYAVGRNVYATVRQHQLQKRIEELSYIQVIYDENAAAAQRADNFTKFDNSTKSMNEYLLDLIDALETNLPVKSYIQSIDIANDTISINVASDEKPAAAQLLINLRELDLISEVDIQNLAESEETETSASEWNYTITANYNPNYGSEEDNNEEAN